MATGRRVAMVRVAWRRVGLKVTVRLVRSKATAIVATVRRVARKVSVRRGVSKANAIAAIVRHVVRKVNVLAASAHRDVSTVNANRVAPKVNATEPIDHHAVRKANAPAANAHRVVSTASAHLVRRAKKAHAGRTVQRHAPRTQAPVATAHRDGSVTIHANAPTPPVPASGPTGVRPARDVTPNVLPVPAAPGVLHSRRIAARANAASGRLRNL
ncbi:hypothetical protein [Paraburkholderia sartisoli]|uniref:hypothetical protein n=1 Tax=Paraburkholderia sartisoli TaxID=83784 RepID=UPI002ADD66BD|nr:hypothetical protein [Paraburkholderia sartisoli]